MSQRSPIKLLTTDCSYYVFIESNNFKWNLEVIKKKTHQAESGYREEKHPIKSYEVASRKLPKSTKRRDV